MAAKKRSTQFCQGSILHWKETLHFFTDMFSRHVRFVRRKFFPSYIHILWAQLNRLLCSWCKLSGAEPLWLLAHCFVMTLSNTSWELLRISVRTKWAILMFMRLSLSIKAHIRLIYATTKVKLWLVTEKVNSKKSGWFLIRFLILCPKARISAFIAAVWSCKSCILYGDRQYPRALCALLKSSKDLSPGIIVLWISLATVLYIVSQSRCVSLSWLTVADYCDP